jgi:ParB/RepB/Spo0J family partition protein
MRKDRHPPEAAADGSEFRDIESLEPNPFNPRKVDADGDPDMEELVASIKSVGLLQPIVITPAGRIIAGHRRLFACRRAGLTRVEVVVRDLGEADQIVAMLAENIQRRALNAVEVGRGCKDLRDRDYTIEQVAVRTAMSTETVRKHLALLTLPKHLQDKCNAGELPLGYVLHLVRLPGEALQTRIALDAIAKQMTVEDLQRLVEKVIGPPKRKYPVADSDPTPKNHVPRVIELLAELKTTLQRNPEVKKDAAVAQWIDEVLEVMALKLSRQIALAPRNHATHAARSRGARIR